MTINPPRRSAKQERFCAVVRWLLYLLLLSLCFILQGTGSYGKPLYVIPAAVCICMCEGVMTACGVGILSGLLLDISCGKLFGSNAILLACCCVMTALLFMHLLRQNIINVLIVTVLCALLQGGLDYLFYYSIWGYEAVGTVFVRYILPGIAYTAIAVLPLYPLFRLIQRKLLPAYGGRHRDA